MFLCFQTRIHPPIIKGTELNCKLQNIQIDFINDQAKKKNPPHCGNSFNRKKTATI